MSKNTTGTVNVTRVPRTKTAKQIARKEANIREAASRLARLQTEQKAMNELRKQGVVGDENKLRHVLVQQSRAKETANAAAYVASVLNGPHGEKVKEWVGPKGLRGTPCKVAMILRNWLATQGLN